MPIWDAIEQLLAADSADAVFAIVRAHAVLMGFDNIGFALRADALITPNCPSGVLLHHTYGNGWAASYQKLQLHRAAQADARVLVSRLNLPAGAWNTRGQMSLPIMRTLIPSAAKQIGVAGEFGMRGGITLPVQTRGADWGFFTFSTDNTHDLRALNACLGDALLLTGTAVQRMGHAATKHPLGANAAVSTGARVQLSPREIEVLRWCAVGKTSWEISEILAISERTVNFHLARVAARFGARGRSAACAIAIAHGLIRI
jgi:DNA-binding CsgD family transcriptional regulator